MKYKTEMAFIPQITAPKDVSDGTNWIALSLHLNGMYTEKTPLQEWSGWDKGKFLLMIEGRHLSYIAQEHLERFDEFYNIVGIAPVSQLPIVEKLKQVA